MKPGARADTLLAVATLAIILGTFFVALRLYTRKAILKKMWVDDYLAIASWVCLMGLAIQNFHNVSTGLGSHFSELSSQDSLAFFRDLWLGLAIYQVNLLFTKSTLFFQFYRILRQTHLDRLKTFYIAIMVTIACWQVGQIFLQIFSCIPVQFAWDKSIHGKCVSVTVMRDMNSTVNLATDLIILLLPLPVLRRLGLPRNQKIAVFCIFGLGFFTCVMSGLRLTKLGPQDSDMTWSVVPVVAWSTAEVLTGVTITSLMTLRPLVGKFVPAWAISDAAKPATAETNSGANRYRLSSMPSRGTQGVSSSDGEATLVYPSRMFSSAAWLDLAAEEADQAADLKVPEPARLDCGPGRSRHHLLE